MSHEKPDDKAKPSSKVGVKVGGGLPPGYRWNITVLDAAHEESRGFLNDVQYQHLARQFRQMAREVEPTQCGTVDARQISDFWELREKGGVLGKINARIFFAIIHDASTIVILGAINKGNEGQTPSYVVVTMQRRLRLYVT